MANSHGGARPGAGRKLKAEKFAGKIVKAESEAARAVGATLVVGGRGLAPEMIARLDHASHGDRMAHLEAIGRSLRSSPIGGASDVPSSE